MAPDPKDPKQQYTPLNAEKSSSVGTGALSIGLLLCLVAACGAFAGGYFLGRSTVPVARAPSSHVLVPPGDASDAREEALGHMSNATAAAMQKLTPNKLAAEMKKLKDVKTVEKTSVDPHEDNESIHRIKTLLKEKKYDAKAICEALGAGGNPCEDDLAKELKKESVDHAKIAAELLQGYFEAGPSSAESPEALKRRLMELPEVEPHHICITGSRAKDVAQNWLSLELQEFLMPSKLSPENQCPVWEQKIGHTLLTVASALPDRCAARFKVHLSSCDILVHAHHEECDDLYKLRLIADQSHASFIVLHSGKMLECYNRRHAEAKRAGLLALTDKEMFLHHKVPLEDHAAESDFRRTLAKSLAKSALHMRLRYFNSHDDGSISSLRARLLTGEGKDLILEALKHSQGFAVHPETAKMLRGAPQRRLSDGEAVVIDQGSGYWKLGFAGDDAPRSVVPAVIGYPTGSPLSPQHQKIFDGAMAQRGVLNLNHPVDGGIVTNWRDYETLLQGALHDELQVAPESHPVLVTEPPLNPKSHRERQTQILFETFNVPAMYIVSEHVLSLYASGRTTGIVVGMGDSVAHTVPIYEGYGLPHAVLRMDLGGRDVTDFLANALREKGHFISVADLEAVRDMKEKVGYVAEDFHNELKAKKEKSYTMPNGKKITLGLERFRAPEIMFKPSLVGKEFSGLHRMAFESVMRCDVDIRRDLYNNMVLSGGNSMFPGMAERLAQEVTAYAPSSIKVKVVAPAPGSLLPWTGGSILASLSHFRSMWVKKEEYDESGPSIVHRKCF